MDYITLKLHIKKKNHIKYAGEEKVSQNQIEHQRWKLI